MSSAYLFLFFTSPSSVSIWKSAAQFYKCCWSTWKAQLNCPKGKFLLSFKVTFSMKSPKYTNNLYTQWPKNPKQLKIKQKNWIDNFSKKTYKWPVEAQHLLKRCSASLMEMQTSLKEMPINNKPTSKGQEGFARI